MEQFPRDILFEWAGATPEIIALYVSGSRARGTARPDSDLDLAIEVDGGSFGPLAKFVRVGWIDELRALTGISVKDLELIEVSRSVKDAVEIRRRSWPGSGNLSPRNSSKAPGEHPRSRGKRVHCASERAHARLRRPQRIPVRSERGSLRVDRQQQPLVELLD
jgi:predicted nucleotidyltransferase